MAEPRRQTRSTEARRQEQSNAEFWSNQLDPLLIENRSQNSEAIQLVRNIVNPTATASTAVAPDSSATQLIEATEPNTTDASRIPPMVFVNDEDLEEQFLTGDEASQEVMDITANKVTTPLDMENYGAPLNPIYTQRSQQDEDLILQPSRVNGPNLSML